MGGLKMGGSFTGLKTLGGVLVLIILQIVSVQQSLASNLTVDEKIEIAKNRCAPPTENEPVLYAETFSGDFTTEEMAELYEKVYKSDDRLLNRVGFHPDSKNFISIDKNDTETHTVFAEKAIKGVILQVEEILKRDYARHVFFPDLGHSHLYIPQDYFKESMRNVSTGPRHALELALKAPGLNMLYHTAEKLRVLDEDRQLLNERDLQWRFYVRNPTGDLLGNIKVLKNFELDKGHNTVSGEAFMPGYKYYFGFNISANKDGCFPFETPKGKLMYFDLSAWDLPYENIGF